MSIFVKKLLLPYTAFDAVIPVMDVTISVDIAAKYFSIRLPRHGTANLLNFIEETASPPLTT
jgi:hypothetical protein